MADLPDKLLCQFNLRIQQVAQFEGLQGVPSTLYPEEFFSVRKLHILFHRYPMVMPFHQREERDTVLSVLQKILIHIVKKLKDILSESAELGGFMPSWKAFLMVTPCPILTTYCQSA